ncbi:MAG: hypothetical protein ACE5JA_06680 [bacterium]
MCRKPVFAVTFAALVLVAVSMSTVSCKKGEEPTVPEYKAGTGTYDIVINIPQDDLRRFLAKVALTVSASDFATITRSQDVSDTATATVTFSNVEVPAGNERLFAADGRDTGSVFLYWTSEMRGVEADRRVGLTLTLVPAGQGVADHIKVFRDCLPWSTYAFDSMLAAEGFTEGAGGNQYEIFPSESMGTATLDPRKDLVVIQNDQDQNFYNEYASNMARFEDFVLAGGSIFWEACDLGWAEGSMRLAGVKLPCGVDVDDPYVYDLYNHVVNTDYPLVSGLPDTIRGFYASHESFIDLPGGTIEYARSVQSNKPTLVQYHCGAGWVVATGQPLEHGYAYGYEIGQLLPRVVRYLLGRSPTTTSNWFPEAKHLSRSSTAR